MFDYSQRPAGKDYLEGYDAIKWETVRIKKVVESDKKERIKMIAKGVNEYAEEMAVKIDKISVDGEKRWVVEARNEGGYNITQVDLKQLLDWVKANKPELLEESRDA